MCLLLYARWREPRRSGRDKSGERGSYFGRHLEAELLSDIDKDYATCAECACRDSFCRTEREGHHMLLEIEVDLAAECAIDKREAHDDACDFDDGVE